MWFNKTLTNLNGSRNITVTSIPAKILEVFENKGAVAGISIFFIAIFIACLIKRIITVRRTKTALKQKFMKITDVSFGDDLEDLKPSKYGDLRFSIDYCFKRNSLKVFDIGISGLHSTSGCEIDSYIILRIEPDLWKLKPRKTNIIQKTNSPNFIKKFFFKIPMIDLNKVTLIFEVFDHDAAATSDQMLGIVRFDVSTLTQGEMEEFPIERRIQISAPVERDEGLGEICVVLKHLPIPHQLNVTILEAKRLFLDKEKSFPPVFVMITMFHQDHIVKKYSTSIKYNTREPFFSETFRFHLKPVKTPYSYLVVKVIQKSIFGFNKCIGQVEIGNNSKTLSGVHQWNQMFTRPKVAFASWHMLS